VWQRWERGAVGGQAFEVEVEVEIEVAVTVVIGVVREPEREQSPGRASGWSSVVAKLVDKYGEIDVVAVKLVVKPADTVAVVVSLNSKGSTANMAHYCMGFGDL